ncbi:39S ribosomal protein L21, mitochondrial [Halotydeus destructor]|nr:39S ribosomal protein L21, mitochondrial [Halotydeus destructor]
MSASRVFGLLKIRVNYAHQVRNLRTIRQNEQAASQLKTEILPETGDAEYSLVNSFFDKVNQDIEAKRDKSRLFAICHLYGQQHRFTEGDLIMVRKHFPAEVGTRVKLEKCMLVGGENVTLIGRPLIDRDLVHIEATLVEKTMGHTITNVIHVPRTHNFKKWYFTRDSLSVLRINEIKICHKLNESQEEVQ